jgi:uncharacterized protein (DUF983 family)
MEQNQQNPSQQSNQERHGDSYLGIQNKCPECGKTMLASEHGTKLKCSDNDCGFEMGYDRNPEGTNPTDEKVQNNPSQPNQDTTTT